ncbi:hypothetical protein Q4543_03790 [Salipiger sp. 1_MG-2023]|uniref:hypothetical protein n=1 Tax=Salipiger sp. 1_MG-2023 TaxID=3062665 RepID=UPI0026E285EE|nr:hypothetical protein [Salipiger sp. 1_MG-2023]MDO6584631.1 hypothetical protein [Salipiger sp. 1_MG-2023]
MKAIVVAGLALALSGCGHTPAPPQKMQLAASKDSLDAQVAQLTEALLALGPQVDPAEAARAADIAVRQPLEWARAWRVEDSPLVHNFKVVNGFRDKGVCQDWADALEIALTAARLRTLDLHRAIGNGRGITLEHATVVITAKDQPWEQGLILDPWRIGQGRLWWAQVADDPSYKWESRESWRAWRKTWQSRSTAPSG